MLVRMLRRVLAALGVQLLLATASAANTASAAPVARPALWKVSDPDTTIYLFGTIHLLPRDYRWQTQKFARTVAKSDELVVETIIDLKRPEEFQATLLRMGYTPGLPPIVERVPPAKRDALRAAIARSGIPESSFNLMETWFAAFQLLGVQFRAMGLQGQEGPEQTLKQAFAAANKPIGELETNAEQLGYFDRLSETAQRQLLEGAIEEPGNVTKEFGGMLGAWARGDVSRIALTFNRDLAGSPEVAHALITLRNSAWQAWIENRLARPGRVMVAVGAGHLAGKDSVIDLLKRRGYKVRRIQ
ncbi:MAG TPA: TraB/GumN family protein [Sphingomicrobium sp.]|nr:TraB/GumN family protein [Sphingomicrobium sp.]